MESATVTKVCPRCGLEKPAEEFGVYKQFTERSSFLRTYCKRCERGIATSAVNKLTLEIFDKLGHSCCRCGFSDKRALQIDHVNGGGIKEHKESSSRYSFLKKVLSDTESLYQILCANCNWIKRSENREVRFVDDPPSLGKIPSKPPLKLTEVKKRVPPTSEQRSENTRRWQAAKTQEERSSVARKREEGKTPEFRTAVALRREAARTPEQRSASAVKREANKRAKRLTA